MTIRIPAGREFCCRQCLFWNRGRNCDSGKGIVWRRMKDKTRSRTGETRTEKPAQNRAGGTRTERPAQSRTGEMRTERPAQSRTGGTRTERPAQSRAGSRRTERKPQVPSDGVRINLYLAKAGVCSRREADRLIGEGRVRVEGVPAENGMRVFPGQKVTVDGREVLPDERMVILAVNKPAGYVCTTDRKWGDPLVGDLVDYPGRVFTAGRLDKDSEGLLLMTNQGELSNRMMKASSKHEKEYVVTIDRPVTDEFVRRMSSGVFLKELGVRTRPCEVRKSGEYEFHIILTQGLNRQIRRMCRENGCRVKKLVRIRIMNVRLGELEKGCWRKLSPHETDVLLQSCGMGFAAPFSQGEDR